jgi:hypothetical protein
MSILSSSVKGIKNEPEYKGKGRKSNRNDDEVDAISALLNLGQSSLANDSRPTKKSKLDTKKGPVMSIKPYPATQVPHSETIQPGYRRGPLNAVVINGNSSTIRETSQHPQKPPLVNFIPVLHQKQQHQLVPHKLNDSSQSCIPPRGPAARPTLRPLIDYDRPSFPYMTPGSLNIIPTLNANGEMFYFGRCMTHVAIAQYIYFNQQYTNLIKEKEREMHRLRIEQKRIQRQRQRLQQPRPIVNPVPKPLPPIQPSAYHDPHSTYTPYYENNVDVLELIQRSRLLLKDNNYHSIRQKEEELKNSKKSKEGSEKLGMTANLPSQ